MPSLLQIAGLQSQKRFETKLRSNAFSGTEPPSPEEWWALRETYEWRCGAIAELDQLYARDGRAPQQLTTFMRLYVYFCRAVCNLRLNLVDDARQAASDFLLILSRGNRGTRCCHTL
jgi:hypothetical protein